MQSCKKFLKMVLSFVLAFCLVVGTMPLYAIAEDNDISTKEYIFDDCICIYNYEDLNMKKLGMFGHILLIIY